MVDIKDIAHSLARLQRFNGHSHGNINVAAHCIWMAKKATDGNKLDALLHDAAEAYTGDLTRPLKYLLGQRFHAYDLKIQWVVAKAFGLPWPPPLEVAELDEEALHSEMDEYMKPNDLHWNWDPDRYALQFLEMFDTCCQLKKKAHPEWELPTRQLSGLNDEPETDEL